jgi:hypothetical protein
MRGESKRGKVRIKEGGRGKTKIKEERGQNKQRY